MGPRSVEVGRAVQQIRGAMCYVPAIQILKEMRMGDQPGRRSVISAAGFSVVASILPSASAAASVVQGGTSGGSSTLEATDLTAVASSLGEDNEPVDFDGFAYIVSTNQRRWARFSSTTGGTLNALVWQFGPSPAGQVSLEEATKARVSFHTEPPGDTDPIVGSAKTPNLGVLQAVGISFNNETQRILLTSSVNVTIPAGDFYIEYYSVESTDLSLQLAEPKSWTSSSGSWSAIEMQPGDGGFAYAPFGAFGTAIV